MEHNVLLKRIFLLKGVHRLKDRSSKVMSCAHCPVLKLTHYRGFHLWMDVNKDILIKSTHVRSWGELCGLIPFYQNQHYLLQWFRSQGQAKHQCASVLLTHQCRGQNVVLLPSGGRQSLHCYHTLITEETAENAEIAFNQLGGRR